MGDRANVLIGDEASRVYLYTHWGGQNLPQTVQNALKRGSVRFNDAPYLARVVFAQMIIDDAGEGGTAVAVKKNLERETGYGISTYMLDNEHPIIYLETMTQRVYFIRPEDAENWNERSATPIAEWTMAEYVQADLAGIMDIWEEN